MSSRFGRDLRKRPGFTREIIAHPSDSQAGLAVTVHHDPGPHETMVTIDQLWETGDIEQIYVGGREDALGLVEALAGALRRVDGGQR